MLSIMEIMCVIGRSGDTGDGNGGFDMVEVACGTHWLCMSIMNKLLSAFSSDQSKLLAFKLCNTICYEDSLWNKVY